MTPEIMAVHHCWLKDSGLKIDPVTGKNDNDIESLAWVDSKQVVTPVKEQPCIEVPEEESKPDESLTEGDLYWQSHPRIKPRN